jgi:D-amino-acid oxidase
MKPSELPPHSRARIALAYTTLVITPPAYLAWLSARLRTRGIRFVRATVSSLAEVADGKFTEGRKADVVVNASGVGAKTLGGCEDADVVAIRWAHAF